MKKIHAVILAIVTCFAFVACGNKENIDELDLSKDVYNSFEYSSYEPTVQQSKHQEPSVPKAENVIIEGAEPIIQAYYGECVKFQNMCIDIQEKSTYDTWRFCEAVMLDLNHDGELELYLFYSDDGFNYFSRAFEYKNGKVNMILNIDALENSWCAPKFFYKESALGFRVHCGAELDSIILLKANANGEFERSILDAYYHDESLFFEQEKTGVSQMYSDYENRHPICEERFDAYADNQYYYTDELFIMSCHLENLTPESFIDYFSYCMEGIE